MLVKGVAKERALAEGFHVPLEKTPLLRWLCLLAGKFASRFTTNFIVRPQAEDRSLFIEERLSFGPKKQLLVVNCYGRRFLMASSADAVTSLVEVLSCDASEVGQ